MRSIEIIIPVKNMADHAELAINSVRSQLRPDDIITVVDDGSTDALPARLQASNIKVIRLEESRGPYAARHIAAASSTADILVFMDARCRALPGWLDAHRIVYDDPDVAMSCTGMRIIGGKSLSGRICEATAMFDLEPRINADGKVDFFPTANLGIRADSYRAVGGFRDMRSGSDVDLCRRVKFQSLGQFGFTRQILMEWVPRDSLNALFKQWIRYGVSSAHLDAVYQAEATSSPEHESPRLGRTRVRAATARLAMKLRDDPASAPAVVGSCLLLAANRLSYLKARRSLKSGVAQPLTFYDTIPSQPIVTIPTGSMSPHWAQAAEVSS